MLFSSTISSCPPRGSHISLYNYKLCVCVCVCKKWRWDHSLHNGLKVFLFNPIIYNIMTRFLFWVIFFGGAVPCSLQDLSSLTRDWTQAWAVKALSPNHWSTREFSFGCSLRLKAWVLAEQISMPLRHNFSWQFIPLKHFSSHLYLRIKRLLQALWCHRVDRQP